MPIPIKELEKDLHWLCQQHTTPRRFVLFLPHVEPGFRVQRKKQVPHPGTRRFQQVISAKGNILDQYPLTLEIVTLISKAVPYATTKKKASVFYEYRETSELVDGTTTHFDARIVGNPSADLIWAVVAEAL